MMPAMEGIRRSSLWTAGVLAFVVLFVFFVLQEYGPESAVRRFHRAVQTKNWREVQLVTKQPFEEWAVQRLVADVASLTQSPGSHRLVRMDRSPGQVRAAVVYYHPRRLPVVRIWIVERFREGWKIDADKTLTTLRDALELRMVP